MKSNRQVIQDPSFIMKLIKLFICLNTYSGACHTETKNLYQVSKDSGNLSQKQYVLVYI